MPLPLLSGEFRRLSADESDWNLVGTTGGMSASAAGRTRGSRRSEAVAATRRCLVPESVALQEGMEELTTLTSSPSTINTSSTEEVEEEAELPTQKPAHSRVILEVSQLEEAFKGYACPDCGEDLELKLWTVCIATNIDLICNNQECSYVCSFARPAPTTMHLDCGDKYERMTNFAVNVLYVLGSISVGDGHTEAGRLLGLLGLPNDTTMMNRSFGIIEERIAPFVAKLCGDIIRENLDEEARLSMTEFDFNNWKRWKLEGCVGLMPSDRLPQLDACYDMAWQQKGSGHVYNSQSGHGSLFGRYSCKIIGLVIKSKLCCLCATLEEEDSRYSGEGAHVLEES
jgi:hypothetical protein